MIIYQTSFLELAYWADEKCLYQHWRGFTSSENFRIGILKSLECMQDYEIIKIITDTREQGLVRKQDTDWVVLEIAPKMWASGLIAQAFVLPQDIFTQVSVQNYSEQTTNLSQQLQISYFENLDSAKKWLQTL